MVTKEDKQLLKQFSVSNYSHFDNINSSQFYNLKLNRIRKCSDDASLSFFQSKTNTYENSGYLTDNLKRNSWNKTAKDLRSAKHLNLNEEAEEGNGVQKRWMSDMYYSNTNNSTLSLHIAAYENSHESFSNKCVDLPKKLKTSNFVVSKFQDCFEFPRQMNDHGNIIPEVQQFSASQKLFSPNQESKSGQTKNPQPLMLNALSYWKALDKCYLFSDADEEQLYSHAGWKLVENIKSRNPLIKWIMLYAPAALLASWYSIFPTQTSKTALIVGGTTFLFSTLATQCYQNLNVKNFTTCVNIFSNSDIKFKQFILDLQEKEVAFFSMGKSDHAKVCSREARIICLKYLRKYADECIAFSRYIKSEMDYPITLCFEMLPDNPKLNALVQINNAIRDEYLFLDSLRNMYQFVFVCRSEMLHLFMVDVIYRNSYEREEMLIRKLIGITEEIEYQGFIRALNYQPSQINHAQNYIRRLQSVPAQRRMACIVQLETLLQQMNSIQSLPADCSSFLRQMNAINNILTTHHREELQKLIAKDPLKPDDGPLDTDFNNDISVETDSNKNEENNMNCYQVFEAIPGTRDNEQNEGRGGGGSGNETFCVDDDNNSQGSISPHKPYKSIGVLDELKTKLQPRQEMALQKEREATAKFRGVPIEDVSIEDVLEDMKHSKKSFASNQNEWLDKPFIGKSVNMGPTTSLMSQIVQRRQTTKTAVIGDNSDSE